tara:strand:+ start:178 stop:681 length:504 start_codon:yes stop_codon:yes gene_type:complete
MDALPSQSLLSEPQLVNKFSQPLILFVGIVLLSLQAGCGGNYQQAVQDFGVKAVMRVDLSNTEVTDDDLAAMDFPDTLREISLANTEITDRGVEHLQQFENLEFINLNNTKITNASLALLKQFENLRSANVTTDTVDVKENKDFLRFMGRRIGNKDELPMVITTPSQ